MARSASKDTYEKFRFRVLFFDFDFSGTKLLNTISLSTSVNDFSTAGIDADQSKLISAGFSNVSLPKVSVKERTYRENIDSLRNIKAPGLVTYEPIIFSKGKTESRGLYNWYKEVNNDANALTPINELSSSLNFIPVFTPEYRRDIVIGLYDRVGNIKKAWFIYNAFPTGYSGGDGLSAQEDAKLIEELTVSYEAFIELNEESLAKAQQESQAAGADSFATGLLSAAVNLGLPF